MKRKNAFKRLRILGVAGILAVLSVACENATQADKTNNKEIVKEEIIDVVETPTQEEENSLIINRQIMHFADPQNPTDFEYKHTPEILIGEIAPKGFTSVIVRVGQNDIVHPVEDNHWIDFITLYADDQKIGHLEFEAGQSLGFATFYVQLEGVQNLKAVAGCNLHGIWESVLAL